jgi:serine phosphatase RsbU (regulator of sigma subunit)
VLVQNDQGLSTGNGIENVLKDVIIQVNDYMATNHGAASMFATMFLGAYVSSTQKLSYVCAGHESPIIVRATGILEHLQTTGPAIGIFAGAQYGVTTTDLSPGQILFTYTDGLVDARSPANVSWGIEGVQGVLASLDPVHTTAKQLLDHMGDKVTQHRSDAEQFDDLTMLIVKINA